MKEYFIYLNIFVNMFYMISGLNKYLHKDDLSIYNLWIDNKTENTNVNTQIIDLLKLNLNKLTKSEDIILLKDIFVKFINLEEDTGLKKYFLREISEIILFLFLKNKYNSKFPQNLFDNQFLNYIISENLFFEPTKEHESSIFEHLVSDIYNIQYFDITFNKSFEDYYIDYVVNLKRSLKEQIYNHISPDVSIIKKVLGIIFIVSKALAISDSSPSKILINHVKNIYISLYNSLYETISINNESLKIYEYIDHENKVSMIDSIKKNIIKQIDQFNTFINDMKLYEYFLEDTLRNAINIDNYVSNIDRVYEKDNLLLTLIYSVDDTYGLLFSGCVDNYQQKSKKCIINIFNDEKINVHLKTKIIQNCGKKCDEKFFFKYIDKLIQFFINIEKFNSDNGYNDKKKVRTTICEIIMNYINQVSEKDFLNIFCKFSKYKQENFYTLYFSHLSEIFSDISKYKLKCYHNKNNTSVIYLIKSILYMYKSIKVLTYLMNECDEAICNKFAEFFHTIISNSYDSKLYSDTPLFKNSELSKNVLTSKCSNFLQEIYEIFYLNLDRIYTKKTFINHFHAGYYNKKLIDNTILLFGEFVYKDVDKKPNKLKDLLNNINNSIEKHHGNKIETDIPTRYLDPITFTLINKPIEIPEVNLILDEYTIYNHLTFSNSNPFTNKPLTKNELVEFNAKNEVAERLGFFSEDILSWKNKL